MKKYDIIWIASILLVAVLSIVNGMNNIGVLQLPDVAIRIIGIVDLICIPIMVFATIKRSKKNDKGDNVQ